MSESLEMKKMTNKDDAKNEIEGIRELIYMMGANDYEFDAIKNILDRLENGRVEPDKAIEEAREIMGSKQNYH